MTRNLASLDSNALPTTFGLGSQLADLVSCSCQHTSLSSCLIFMKGSKEPQQGNKTGQRDIL